MLALLAAFTLLAVVVLALPVQRWRTGEIPQPSFHYTSNALVAVNATRVWIDADAACGTGKRRDPDDCLALLSMGNAPGADIVGISTVFGNAPVSETDAVMRALVGEMGSQGHRVLPVFKGCGGAGSECLNHGGSLEAQAALRRALNAGPLDYLALGPLTNLAAVLELDPALAVRITRVIAVMGRRPGHRFHPSENRGTGAMLFGHGPIFRDLNAVLDPRAVSLVLRSGVPIVLVPYTAARQVSMTSGELDGIAGMGQAGRWVAERSRQWLAFWRDEAGLDGFYPFDLMAAAYVRDPARFRCAHVNAWVGDDALLPWLGGGPTLLVTQLDAPLSASAVEALYCDVVSAGIGEMIR